MADTLHVIHEFGGIENIKGKKIAMTWAYSPSYGKPLSVPQGAIGLLTRLGANVVLAHPEGYDVMPEVEEVARKNAAASGGSYTKTNSMAEAFKDADIVYPKSWAPFARNVPSFTARAISTASMLSKKSCLPRTLSTKTGPAPRSSWQRPKTARPSICTACLLTSQM